MKNTKNVKNIARVLLAVFCLAYLVWFVKDLESLLDYQRIVMTGHSAATWFWLFFGELTPVISLVLASVYAFSMYLWKKRWALTAAVALMCIMLAFSEVFHINESFKALHPSVALLAAGIYIACIYAVKVPYRCYIAGGVMAVLLISFCIGGSTGGEFSTSLSWLLRYSAPVIPLGLLGLILPQQYD